MGCGNSKQSLRIECPLSDVEGQPQKSRDQLRCSGSLDKQPGLRRESSSKHLNDLSCSNIQKRPSLPSLVFSDQQQIIEIQNGGTSSLSKPLDNSGPVDHRNPGLTEQLVLNVRVKGKHDVAGPTFTINDPSIAHQQTLKTTVNEATEEASKDQVAINCCNGESPITKFKQRKRYGLTYVGKSHFSDPSKMPSLDSEEIATPNKIPKRITPQKRSMADLNKLNRSQNTSDYMNRVNSLERRMVVGHRTSANIMDRIKRVSSFNQLPSVFQNSLKKKPVIQKTQRKTSLEILLLDD